VAAILYWLEARAQETSAALERAVEHAARVGDRRQEAEDLALLTMTSSWGPVPVDEGIRRTRHIIDRSHGHRKVEALALATLSHLEARRGNVEEARKNIEEGRRRLRELGLHVLAAATSHAAGYIELIAGRPDGAEEVLREGYTELARMGEKAYLSTVAVDLAEALYRRDDLEEAESFTRISEGAADPSDLSSQIGWRSVRAKVLARRGSLDEAERLARDAVTLADGTDFVDEAGDALSDLAEVLVLTGRNEAARAELLRALELYERKGNLVLAERARRRLAELAPS
jgi:tetratricopeptide (TPR) repeat protein